MITALVIVLALLGAHMMIHHVLPQLSDQRPADGATAVQRGRRRAT